MESFDTAQAADGLYSCGHALFTDSRYADAATVFRALAAAVPSDERGWLGLGACHEAVDQNDLAIELYRLGEDLASSARCAVARSRALGVGEERRSALEIAATLAKGDAQLEAIVRAEKMQ